MLGGIEQGCSERHEAILRKALRHTGIPVLGAIKRNTALAMPERHLGLVQADEHQNLGRFIDLAADILMIPSIFRC